MRDLLEKRRTELADELEAGRNMLAELDSRRSELQQTLLRISGALQVVGELLEAVPAEQASPTVPARPAGHPGELPEDVDVQLVSAV